MGELDNGAPILTGWLGRGGQGDEIWVAAGTYYPDASDTTKSFVLKGDFALYGGFLGVIRQGVS